MALPHVPDGVLGLTCLLALCGLVLLALWLGRQERRARHGHEIHAHGDGTVHEHFRGNAPHVHPTAVERYDSWLTRILGPAPVDRS